MRIERIRQLEPAGLGVLESRQPLQKRQLQPTVATIGNFDGVHLGHRRALLLAHREAEKRDAALAAVTFDPHPARLLRPDLAPKSITSLALKAEQLESVGVQRLLVVEFNAALARITPAEFVERLLVSRLGARAVVQGRNFRFGRGRSGDLDTLRELGAQHGFRLIEAPTVSWKGSPISSSRIRDALAAGDLDLAAALLGRPYEIAGVVVPGRGRGRTLGFPTANLEPEDEVLLPHGVYAAEAMVGSLATVAAARRFRAVVHHGPRPTFRDSPSLEAHLIGFSGQVSALRLCFRAFLRPIAAFAGADPLRAQLEHDVSRVRDPESFDFGPRLRSSMIEAASSVPGLPAGY